MTTDLDLGSARAALREALTFTDRRKTPDHHVVILSTHYNPEMSPLSLGELRALAAEPEVEGELLDHLAEIVAVHTPDLVREGPHGEDDGQHYYCVECGVLPPGDNQPGEHVARMVLATVVATGEAGRG